MLSGVQRVSLEELRRLDPEIYDRHLLTCEPGPLSEAAAELGVTCHHEPRLKRSISPWNDFQVYQSLRDLMRREAFDVVHTHSSKTGVLGRMAAAAADIPCVVHTVHGFAFPAARFKAVRKLYQWCETRCGQVTDALVCLNSEDRQISIEQLDMPSERIEVIANGVDTDAFRPIEDQEARIAQRAQRLPGDPERPAVMMIGRLWKQKQPEAFVAAAVALIQNGSDAHFYLAGDGNLRSQLEESIQAAGVTDRVHLLGWRDDVSALLPLADVMVLPSLWEGMPIVLLESHACGVPIVASDIPGNRDCVIDGVDGHLVPKNDPQCLAKRIGELVNDPQERKAMGAAGREKIVREFDIQYRQRAIESLYERLLAR
ncbi:glycosyltransferase family 4 protein [Rhodopirellula baltica]